MKTIQHQTKGLKGGWFVITLGKDMNAILKLNWKIRNYEQGKEFPTLYTNLEIQFAIDIVWSVGTKGST